MQIKDGTLRDYKVRKSRFNLNVRKSQKYTGKNIVKEVETLKNVFFSSLLE